MYTQADILRIIRYAIQSGAGDSLGSHFGFGVTPMTCTAIITDGYEIDQIIEHQGDWKPIVAREVKDLNSMGCNTRTMIFENEAAAYAWQEKKRGY